MPGKEGLALNKDLRHVISTGLGNTILPIMVGLSPRVGKLVAKNYWESCDKTQPDTSTEAYEQIYSHVLRLMEPARGDRILDAGCGAGQISERFYRDGFEVAGFDASTYSLSRAKQRTGLDIFYQDEFVDMRQKGTKYDKVVIIGAFAYVHPRDQIRALTNMHDILTENGKLYIVNEPDYEKRALVYRSNPYYTLAYLTSFFFPVYHGNSAQFWIRPDRLENDAKRSGFSRVDKVDSWHDYRSDFVLHKSG